MNIEHQREHGSVKVGVVITNQNLPLKWCRFLSMPSINAISRIKSTPLYLILSLIMCRHPETSKRPDFVALSQHLSDSQERRLLKWTEDDRSTHPNVDRLGAEFLIAENLYMDLQVIYKQMP
jgi:hypothetical protein